MAKDKQAATPEKITFRGAHIVNFDMRQSSNGETSFVRVHMRADFSDPVREAMGWDPRPEGWGGGSLDGELAGVEMMLKPSQGELGKYAFKMPIRTVKNFELIVKGSDDEEEEILAFTVETNAKRAYAPLGLWVENIGTAKAALTVTYAEDEQLEIGGVTATEEQRQAVLEED